MYRLVFLILAVMSVPKLVFAQTPAWAPAPGHTSLSIWPHGAPGATPNPAPETDTTKASDYLVAGKRIVRLTNVSDPTLTVYSPAAAANTGAAIVVFPGGAYRILAIDLEGTEVCDWLSSAGITCVLLKYRVPDSGPYPKSSAALQDAQRAVGIVRSRAKDWHIDPHRIGVLGFSAGAHLAAALSTHFDRRLYELVDGADQVSCRPDFAVIVYPGYLALAEQNFAPNPEIQPTDKTPPSFIVQAEDDPVHVENSTVYFMALKNAKVQAELHLYAQGGHGYGLRRTALPVTWWPAVGRNLATYNRGVARRGTLICVPIGEVSLSVADTWVALLGSGGFCRSFHHRLFHAILACPIQADLVAVRIVQIRVAPTPGHHLWQLGDIETFLLQLATEVVEFAHLEIQPDAVARNRRTLSGLVEGNRSVSSRSTEPGVNRLIFVPEILD
jgi:acetyl esterase/lipase